MSSYINPSYTIPVYTTTSSGSSTVQLVNNGVNPAVNVSFFVTSAVAPTVFFDSRAMVPCFIKYRSPGTTWSIFCDNLTQTNGDPTELFIQVIAIPDPTISVSASSLAGVLQTIQSNITSVTSNLATQVAKESSDNTALSSTLSTHTTQITTLQNNYTTLSAQVTALMSMVSTMNSNLSVVLSTLVSDGALTLSGSTYSAVSGISFAQIGINKTNIATNSTNITSIKSAFNNAVSVANTNAGYYNQATALTMAQGSNKSPQMQNEVTLTAF